MLAKFIQSIVMTAMLLPLLGIGQTIRGRVIDAQTLEAIPYVNIGVLKGERGTVSNVNGDFWLDLTGAKPDAILRYSFIGYENYDVSVLEMGRACSTYCEVQLIPKVLEMQNVVVYPREYAEKLVGNPKPLKNAMAGFKNDSLGYELGIRVRIKKRPTLLKDFRLYGLATTFDTVFYRLNVYEMDGGDPGNNILKEPIYITLTDFTNGEDIVIDLSSYHIVVQDDFVISLEYVRKLGEGSLHVRTGFLSGKTYYRKTSQGEWYSIPLGLGMSVLIRFEK